MGNANHSPLLNVGSAGAAQHGNGTENATLTLDESREEDMSIQIEDLDVQIEDLDVLDHADTERNCPALLGKEVSASKTSPQKKTNTDQSFVCLSVFLETLREVRNDLRYMKLDSGQLVDYIGKERANAFTLIPKDIQEIKREREHLEDFIMDSFVKTWKELESLIDEKVHSSMTICRSAEKGIRTRFGCNQTSSPKVKPSDDLHDLTGVQYCEIKSRGALTGNAHMKRAEELASLRGKLHRIKEENRKLFVRIDKLFSDTEKDMETILDGRLQPKRRGIYDITDVPSGGIRNYSCIGFSDIVGSVRDIRKGMVDVRNDLLHFKLTQRQAVRHFRTDRREMSTQTQTNLDSIETENVNLEARILKLVEKAKKSIENHINDVVSGVLRDRM